MKLNEVYPSLFVRGQFYKWERDRKFFELKRNRIDAIVCCITSIDGDMLDSEFKYFHRPMPDSDNINEAQVEEIAALIAVMLKNGLRVVVHCRAGQNRSAFIAARAIQILTMESGQRVIERVRRGRPNALTNPWFRGYLIRKGQLFGNDL